MAEQGEVMTFDEILADKEYQSEFDRRVSKALDTAKEKWDTEKNGLKEQLKSASEQIKAFEGMDVDGIKKAADEWKLKAEESEKSAAARIAEIEYASALKDALSGTKFSSEYARNGIMTEILSKKLPIEDGKIMGLDDVLTAMKEAKPDAFVAENAKVPATATFGGTGKTPLVPNEADNIKADFAKAVKSKDHALMAFLTRNAQEKGVKLE